MNLPPLPKEKCLCGECSAYGYEEDDLRAYAAAAVRAEREACAKECEEYARCNVESDIMVHAFLHCAASIRSRT